MHLEHAQRCWAQQENATPPTQDKHDYVWGGGGGGVRGSSWASLKCIQMAW